MSITIKDVPKDCIFTKGQIVEVNGELKSGIGKVILAYYPTKQPESELSYSLKYNEPFPQIGLLFEDGEKLHYNANDLLAGKIKSTITKFREAKTLKDYLNCLIVSNSYIKEEKSLLKIIIENKIDKFIELLMNKKVYCNTQEKIFLGEFDRYEYIFKSVKIGEAIRNSGEHAFTLKIAVDGYAPSEIELKISEVYYEMIVE